MIFTKSHSIIIIGLVLISLTGLSFIQLNWLNGAKAIQEEKVQDRLDKVIEELKPSFTHQMLKGGYFNSTCSEGLTIKTKQLIADAERIMDSVLRVRNVLMPYELGITTCQSNQFSWFSDPAFEDEIRNARQFKLDGYEFSTPVGRDHLHFYTLFSQQDKLIFREMSLAIGSSVLFMLLLTAVIVYMLYTIFRQKKLTAMKNDFINNLTHEFKTPIASISLAAKTMNRLEVVRQSPKALDYLNLINQEGKRLENHIDKVLQMATLDRGNFDLDKTAVDVHQTIKRVRESFSVLLEKKGGRIILIPKAINGTIQADGIHLFNIVYNLVDNAIKYHDKVPMIRISTEEEKASLSIVISDNGLGMSKEVQKQVFDQFYREKTGNVHDVKGFGLGLAYVKKMMEAHGGRVELDSQQGRGTTFRLIFKRG